MRHFIFVTRAVPAPTLELLRAELPGCQVVVNQQDRNLSRDEILAAARGASGLICTLADPVDRALLQGLSPALRVVATYAVGTNNIDLEAARELNIRVANTPGVLTDATAEIAVGLMLACARRMVEGDAMTRAGRFHGWAPLLHLGRGVYGKTVGIVGAGRIGKRVAASMHHGFGCPVLYASRSLHADWESELGARQVPLDDLLRQSDFVSIHCPLTPETRHLLNAQRLALLKPTAVLVNTGRGPVVDEAALVAALRAGRLLAAGFDVYEREPALADGLKDLPNAVLLPHIGSATVETRDEMGRMCAQAVADVLNSREPRHPVA